MRLVGIYGGADAFLFSTGASRRATSHPASLPYPFRTSRFKRDRRADPPIFHPIKSDYRGSTFLSRCDDEGMSPLEILFYRRKGVSDAMLPIYVCQDCDLPMHYLAILLSLRESSRPYRGCPIASLRSCGNRARRIQNRTVARSECGYALFSTRECVSVRAREREREREGRGGRSRKRNRALSFPDNLTELIKPVLRSFDRQDVDSMGTDASDDHLTIDADICHE